MEKLIVLDTELTGLDIASGHRIASLGMVKLAKQSSRDIKREWFFKTDIPTDADGMRIHGMSQEFLSRFYDFKASSHDISHFIDDCYIVHHCWVQPDDTTKDEEALAAEFNRAGLIPIPHERWINIKKVAMALSPDKNSLDHMLDRFGIDRRERAEKHGALVDARLTTKLLRKMQRAPETAGLIEQLLP